jgi:hypothetical protein
MFLTRGTDGGLDYRGATPEFLGDDTDGESVLMCSKDRCALGSRVLKHGRPRSLDEAGMHPRCRQGCVGGWRHGCSSPKACAGESCSRSTATISWSRNLTLTAIGLPR